MSYNAKNYTEQGGDVTHIVRTLIIEEGASVVGLPSAFTPAENQADSKASTIAALKEDFNGLLAKLVAAGLMAEAETSEESNEEPNEEPGE